MQLGLFFSHNASVSVVDPATGRILFCSAEERFSRRKNDWGIPRRALAHVFDSVAAPGEITGVAVGERCAHRYGSRAFGELINLVDYAVKDATIRDKPRVARAVLGECLGRALGRHHELTTAVRAELTALGLGPSPVFVDHHASHAAGAFYTAPFDDALVVTLDGEGDGQCGSCWHGQGGHMTLLHQLPDTASPGLFYKYITALLGFKVNQQEGKVTGLAARGNPDRFYAPLRAMLHVEGHGENIAIRSRAAEDQLGRMSRKRVNFLRLISTAPALLRATRWEPLLNAVLQRQCRELYAKVLPCDLTKLREEERADIAAGAQRVLEETVLALVHAYAQLAPSRHLVLSGGVFANVALNQRLLENTDFAGLYVYPAMGDEGLALGAALHACHQGRATRHVNAPMQHIFHGPAFTKEAISVALRRAKERTNELPMEERARRVAALLARDGMVGIFQGAAEFGPRALGNRSILAHPAGRDVSARLNEKLRRSDFMPFAPAVLTEHAHTLFDREHIARALHCGRFMTVALPVAAAWRNRIPAVVHVDGTARPQFVSRAHEAFLSRVIEDFFALTGIPCVLNTSFNLHEEPLVASPEDALCAACASGLDALVMGKHFVERTALAVDTPRPAIQLGVIPLSQTLPSAS